MRGKQSGELKGGVERGLGSNRARDVPVGVLCVWQECDCVSGQGCGVFQAGRLPPNSLPRACGGPHNSRKARKTRKKRGEGKH